MSPFEFEGEVIRVANLIAVNFGYVLRNGHIPFFCLVDFKGRHVVGVKSWYNRPKKEVV